MLGDQEVDLAAADAMLTSAGAVERQRAIDESLVEPFGLRHLLRLIRVEHEADVKIALSGTPDYPCRQKGNDGLFARFYRDTGFRHPPPKSGLKGVHRQDCRRQPPNKRRGPASPIASSRCCRLLDAS
jgi:hypothetical protein